jgi:hypothetical protein
VRYEVLHRHGGVYVDTDVECLRPLTPLLRGIDAFAALEAPGRIGSAIMGSVAGHRVFARAARLARHTVGTGAHSVDANGPRFLSLIVEQESNLAIFAARLFYPYLWDELERRNETFPDAYAVHHWALSHVRRELAAEREAELTTPRLWGPGERLHVASTAVLNDTLLNTVSGNITVEEYAFFGHGVALLTGTHDVSRTGRERQLAIPSEGHDIVIGAGAWIASRAIVLGPCRIGANAVVAAGAVVSSDVPAGAIAAGVPARLVGHSGAACAAPPAGAG